MLFDPNGGRYHESLWKDVGLFRRIDPDGQRLQRTEQSSASSPSFGLTAAFT